jgi:ribosome recycling factor
MELVKDIEQKLKDLTGKLQTDLQAVRSNRPSVGLVEEVKVEAYGEMLPINQLGSLSIRPPREILVNVWDNSMIPAVAKAIENSRMGFSVAVDSTTIRVILPPLTDERRAEMTKLVKRMTEDVRIAVRGTREDFVKRLRSLEDEGGMGEDQAFKTKEQIQKAVDVANQKIESLLDAKLAELSE